MEAAIKRNKLGAKADAEMARKQAERARKEAELTALVDQRVPECQQLAKDGNLNAAIEQLLAVEKRCRQAEHEPTTSRVAVAMLALCADQSDWQALNATLVVLSKRRGQLKETVAKAVRSAMALLDGGGEERLGGKAAVVALIDTVRTVTEGKMHVEVERARVTKRLAELHEAGGDVEAASRALQELQIETFNTMELREKCEFLLEQMRLCLDCGDFVRTLIISRKVNRKTLEKDDFQDLKLRFYALMVRYHTHKEDFMAVFRCYQSIYNTPTVQEDEAQWPHNLRLMCAYLVLAPHDNERADMLERLQLDQKIEEMVQYQRLLRTFTTVELIRWPQFKERFQGDLGQLPILSGAAGEGAERLWEQLRMRVVQHNIRVLSTYYDAITFERMTELLELSPEETEASLSTMVSDYGIYAKVDRPAGRVQFAARKDVNDMLNEWGSGMSKLLDMVERTCNLIDVEYDNAVKP